MNRGSYCAGQAGSPAAASSEFPSIFSFTLDFSRRRHVSGHDFQSCRKALSKSHFLAASGMRAAKRSARKKSTAGRKMLSHPVSKAAKVEQEAAQSAQQPIIQRQAEEPAFVPPDAVLVEFRPAEVRIQHKPQEVFHHPEKVVAGDGASFHVQRPSVQEKIRKVKKEEDGREGP